ncbi:mucin-19-like [Mizuhopecten yessoensis]|uniref:mucin-19-like n=1 Tax=Mizuhopecten yessoensis TaxID=6573 RepID=UPI000B45E639|nr:mucin-19-like [Mizuhopecten yessoensis]
MAMSSITKTVYTAPANSNPTKSSPQASTKPTSISAPADKTITEPTSGLTGRRLPAAMAKANSNPTIPSPPPNTIFSLVMASASTNQTKAQKTTSVIPAAFNAPISTIVVVAQSPASTIPGVSKAALSNISAVTKTQRKTNPSVALVPAGSKSNAPSDPTSIQSLAQASTSPSMVSVPASNNSAFLQIPLNTFPSVGTASSSVTQPVYTVPANVNTAKSSAPASTKPTASSAPADKTIAGATAAAISNLAFASSQKSTNPAVSSGLTGISPERATAKIHSSPVMASAPAITNLAVPSAPPNANALLKKALTSIKPARSSPAVFDAQVSTIAAVAQARASDIPTVVNAQGSTISAVAKVLKSPNPFVSTVSVSGEPPSTAASTSSITSSASDPAIKIQGIMSAPVSKTLAVTMLQASKSYATASASANTRIAVVAAPSRSNPSLITTNKEPSQTSDPVQNVSSTSANVSSTNAVLYQMHADPVQPTSGTAFHIGTRTIANATETPHEITARQSVSARVTTNNASLPTNTVTASAVGQSNPQNKMTQNSPNPVKMVHPDSVDKIASQILASLLRMAGTFSQTSSSKSNLTDRSSISRTLTKSLTDALRHSVAETQVELTGNQTAESRPTIASQTSKYSQVLASQVVQPQHITAKPSISVVYQEAPHKPAEAYQAVTSPPITQAVPTQPNSVTQAVTQAVQSQQAEMTSVTTPPQVIQRHPAVQPPEQVRLNQATSPQPTIGHGATQPRQAAATQTTSPKPAVVDRTAKPRQSTGTMATPVEHTVGNRVNLHQQGALSSQTTPPQSTIADQISQSKSIKTIQATPHQQPTVSKNGASAQPALLKHTAPPQEVVTVSNTSTQTVTNQVALFQPTEAPSQTISANQVNKAKSAHQNNVAHSVVSSTNSGVTSKQQNFGQKEAGLASANQPSMVFSSVEATKQTIFNKAAVIAPTVLTADPISSYLKTTLNDQLHDRQLNADKTGRTFKLITTALPSIASASGPASTTVTRATPLIGTSARGLSSGGNGASTFNSPPSQPSGTSYQTINAGEIYALQSNIDSGGSGSRIRSTQAKVMEGKHKPQRVTVHQLSTAGTPVDTARPTQNQLPSNSIGGPVDRKKDPSYLAWEFAALAAGIVGTTASPYAVQLQPHNDPVVPEVPAGLEFLSFSQQKGQTNSNNLLQKLISNSLNPVKSLNNNNQGQLTNLAASAEPVSVMTSGGRNNTVNAGQSHISNVAQLGQPHTYTYGVVGGDMNQAQSSIVQSNFNNPFGLDLPSPERATTQPVVLSAFYSSPVSKSRIEHAASTPKDVTTLLSKTIVNTKTVITSKPLGTKDVVNRMPGTINMLEVLSNAVQNQQAPTATGQGKTVTTEQGKTVTTGQGKTVTTGKGKTVTTKQGKTVTTGQGKTVTTEQDVT